MQYDTNDDSSESLWWRVLSDLSSRISMLKGLVKLIRRMDGLNGPAELSEMEALLREADVSREELVQACKFNNSNYARTIFSKSPWYQLLVICWRAGQSSPIHDHPGSHCAVRIVDGIATESIYEKTSLGQVRVVQEVEHYKDDICSTSDTGIHVISNRQTVDDLVTLHLYSPPLKMTIYHEQEVHERTYSEPDRPKCI